MCEKGLAEKGLKSDRGDHRKGGGSPLQKQYRIWLLLLAKRLWRQPAYVGLLVLIPLIGLAVGVSAQREGGGAAVAVCVEDGSWAERIADGLRQQEKDSVLTYVFCAESSDAESLVLRGGTDCGFVIPADIEERIMENDRRKCVTVYETNASSITGMAKERIAEVLFQCYSEQSYMDYMEALSPELSDYAWEAYETHLTDGSTFDFRYLYDDQYSQQENDEAATYDMTAFPAKGVFAVIIFIGGMCGMLEYDRDLQEKRFLRIAPNALTYVVDVWLPTVFISAAALVCLWLSEGVRAAGGHFSPGTLLSVWDAGEWLSQIGRLIAYQLIVAAYCCMLRLFLRRRETIAAAIPLLSLGSLVCSPVFVRLAAYVPVFAVLEKLFPATYYLQM